MHNFLNMDKQCTTMHVPMCLCATTFGKEDSTKVVVHHHMPLGTFHQLQLPSCCILCLCWNGTLLDCTSLCFAVHVILLPLGIFPAVEVVNIFA